MINSRSTKQTSRREHERRANTVRRIRRLTSTAKGHQRPRARNSPNDKRLNRQFIVNSPRLLLISRGPTRKSRPLPQGPPYTAIRRIHTRVRVQFRHQRSERTANNTSRTNYRHERQKLVRLSRPYHPRPSPRLDPIINSRLPVNNRRVARRSTIQRRTVALTFRNNHRHMEAHRLLLNGSNIAAPQQLSDVRILTRRQTHATRLFKHHARLPPHRHHNNTRVNTSNQGRARHPPSRINPETPLKRFQCIQRI